MIDWLAICTPVYPPHYEFAYQFLEKTKDLFHVYYIFSSQEDYDAFERKDAIHPLIYPEPIGPDTDAIINKKKLFALRTLQHTSYTYLLVLDAETAFLPDSFDERTFRASLESFFERKRIYGKGIYESPHLRQLVQVMKTCAEVFPSETWGHLLQETRHFSVYTWWSDLPLYKREHLPHFFSILQSPYISWFHFDHILYSYYLILYHSFSIYSLDEWIHDRRTLLEDYIPSHEKEALLLHRVGVPYLYVHTSFYDRYPSFFQTIGTLFLYHLNRPIPRRE